MSRSHVIFPAPAELIPQSGSMVLIDAIESSNEQTTTALVSIHKESLFLTPFNQVPSWVGIEYMLQTVAAHVFLHTPVSSVSMEDKRLKIGLFLGARRIELMADGFAIGQTLRVLASVVWQDQGMAVFDSSIELLNEKTTLAKASLNVYQPKSLKELLEAK